jgi:mRNA-degrading endonuclease RelE of RelBE toxin-antitoxin system
VKVRFTLAAEFELDEAIAFYEKCEPGLGQELLREVANTVALIEELPEAWPLVTDIDRACRVKRFPYRVVYFIDDAGIVVLAVAHFKRRLLYWRDRIRN